MTKRADRPEAKQPGGAPEAKKAAAGPVALPGGPAIADAAAAALAPLRQRIDAIDREIVALLNERAEIALKIGRLKDASGGRAIRDPRREAEVIERVTSTSAGLFPEPELVALYRRLIAATRQVQADQRRRAKLAEGEPRG
jgi:chorismate mutase/prephenate dehydratase